MTPKTQLTRAYDLLSEKIHRLNMALIIEVGAAVRFQLEKQIEAAEAERQRILQQLEGTEKLALICPYRGLAAFREQDEAVFFGRETYTQQLFDAVQQKPFTALIGASGSGKSSVVYAGLFPHLRRQGNWLIVSFRPGAHPLPALLAELLPFWQPNLTKGEQLAEVKKVNAYIFQHTLTLQEVLRDVAKVSPDSRLLVFADQFEEVYTLCRDENERRHLLDELLQTCEVSKTSQVFLVLTMRADFLGKALAYRPLADALQNAILTLGPMTHEEFHATIEEPAKKLGVEIEEGLTDRILAAVSSEPGNLPLLEFALTELWNKQAEGKLTHAAYEAIGGVEQALTTYAERKYQELSATEQDQVRRIFTQLIRPGEGTEDTRRVATRAEVGEENWDLIAKLADTRLVVTSTANVSFADQAQTRTFAVQQETVEVVHEALIRGWQSLRAWMDADRDFRTWQERLRAAMRQWQQSRQDDGALLRGAPLLEAEQWGQERPAELSADEQQFIQASSDLRKSERAARERVRKRNIMALTTGLIIAIALSIVAWIFWYRADEARREADRRALISTAQSLVAYANQLTQKGERERAALLTRQAYLLNQRHRGQINDQIDAALRLILLDKEGKTDTLVEQVCQKVSRNLTPEEWRQAAGDGIPYEPCPGLADTQKGATFSLRLRNAPLTTTEIRDLSLNLHFDGFPATDIINDFEDRGKVVMDHATGLMWQKSGSNDTSTHAAAEKYCQDLSLAGKEDWRLPTIEELLSLLELKAQSNNLYINPIFDAKQTWVWSADTRRKDEPQGERSAESAWDVFFNYGSVDWYGVPHPNYVRCVRCGQ